MNPANHRGAPMWVQNQRNSWHGVDFPYHNDLNIAEYYQRYAETLLAVDQSIGRVMDWLKQRGWYESTLVIYMGDNGFAFGEHGLIDKRTAYEESMRVPMLAQCPELFKGGAGVNEVVAKIDIAPTILEAAGLQAPKAMAGRSFVALAKGEKVNGRETPLYEYYCTWRSLQPPWRASRSSSSRSCRSRLTPAGRRRNSNCCAAKTCWESGCGASSESRMCI